MYQSISSILLFVHVEGLEPHSVMPVALPIVFNKTAKGLPKALQGCWKLGTSVVR